MKNTLSSGEGLDTGADVQRTRELEEVEHGIRGAKRRCPASGMDSAELHATLNTRKRIVVGVVDAIMRSVRNGLE